MPAKALAFMGNADQDLGYRAATGAPVLHLFFQADPASVRRALKTALGVLRDLVPARDRASAVEIVLAEAFNNVVEHAYAESGCGLVELEVERMPAALAFRIRDEGVEMPGGDVPPGAAHDLEVSVRDLPEGGFGWFLIHELTEDLTYRRVGNRNELTFRIAFDPEVADG